MTRITDVSAEAVLLAGGARAILLQLANPGVARAVARHSDFGRRPLDRLNHTLTYLYVIVYGTPDEAAAVARRVGAAHEPVHGDGYDARDVDAQFWVAATIYDTARKVHELVFDSAWDDQLLADYAVVGTAIGVPARAWPTSQDEFARYWDSALLAVGDDAVAVARALLHPTTGPLWLRAAMPTVRMVTAGLLTPDLRAAYDLPLDERRFERWLRLVRVIYPRLPRWIRHAPQRRYLREFRASLVAG